MRIADFNAARCRAAGRAPLTPEQAATAPRGTR